MNTIEIDLFAIHYRIREHTFGCALTSVKQHTSESYLACNMDLHEFDINFKAFEGEMIFGKNRNCLPDRTDLQMTSSSKSMN